MLGLTTEFRIDRYGDIFDMVDKEKAKIDRASKPQ
jgi:hypothetical protein